VSFCDNRIAYAYIDVDMAELAKQCVDEGAARLDETYGDGWVLDLDAQIEQLDVSECGSCVLGILYGGYTTGCNHLGMSSLGYDAAELGFDTQSWRDRERYGKQVTYEQLQEAWEELIAYRLGRS